MGRLNTCVLMQVTSAKTEKKNKLHFIFEVKIPSRFPAAYICLRNCAEFNTGVLVEIIHLWASRATNSKELGPSKLPPLED